MIQMHFACGFITASANAATRRIEFALANMTSPWNYFRCFHYYLDSMPGSSTVKQEDNPLPANRFLQ